MNSSRLPPDGYSTSWKPVSARKTGRQTRRNTSTWRERDDGLLQNPEATKEVFTEDGWLRTGDLGTLDDDNNLYIRGRSKTMILSSSGQNIFPEEIEARLNNMPFVLESLVIERNKRLVALVYADYEALDSLGLNQPDNLKTIMDENLKI